MVVLIALLPVGYCGLLAKGHLLQAGLGHLLPAGNVLGTDDLPLADDLQLALPDMSDFTGINGDATRVYFSHFPVNVILNAC